mmetsp:Transcript_14142/g.38808  ORF Transcript_14142/g.38808 Transcript_14142/m.38808 type:complete len:346 (-) Transcript_14142:268-1305(-)
MGVADRHRRGRSIVAGLCVVAAALHFAELSRGGAFTTGPTRTSASLGAAMRDVAQQPSAVQAQPRVTGNGHSSSTASIGGSWLSLGYAALVLCVASTARCWASVPRVYRAGDGKGRGSLHVRLGSARAAVGSAGFALPPGDQDCTQAADRFLAPTSTLAPNDRAIDLSAELISFTCDAAFNPKPTGVSSLSAGVCVGVGEASTPKSARRSRAARRIGATRYAWQRPRTDARSRAARRATIRSVGSQLCQPGAAEVVSPSYDASLLSTKIQLGLQIKACVHSERGRELRTLSISQDLSTTGGGSTCTAISNKDTEYMPPHHGHDQLMEPTSPCSNMVGGPIRSVRK